MMRKNLTIFCVFAMSLFMVGSAFGENNANAYFKLDKNIATAGYQEGNSNVTGIGAGANVGFAVYSQACDNLKGFKVKFEWDATKASLKTTSGPKVLLEDATVINGETINPITEENMLGTSLMSPGPVASTGSYEVAYAMQGGTTVTTPTGLLYFGVFKTATSFNDDTTLSIKVSVTVSDEAGVEKFLGYRFFNVGPVAVKSQTWGEVKSQFKDF